MAAYRSAEDALGFAYGLEARVICKTQALGAPSGGGANPWELHADAALIRRVVQNTASGLERDALEAFYTIPADAVLMRRKLRAAHRLTCALARPEQTRAPWWYVWDTVREWSGLARHHPDRWWQRRLQVSGRTLRRWRLGGRNRCPGIIGRVEALRGRGLDEIDEVLRVRGLIS